MIKFSFIENKSIDFIPCKSSEDLDLSKSCPICSNSLGKIGIIHKTRKECMICRRTVCSKCAQRKISAKRIRICKTCYVEGLETYYMHRAVKELTRGFPVEENEIQSNHKN